MGRAGGPPILRLNRPDVPAHHGEMAELSVDRVLAMIGLHSGERSLVDGGPPCQDIGMVANGQLDNLRISLFRGYARLLSGLRTRAFVMENVTGMARGMMCAVYAEALAAPRAAGPGYRTASRSRNNASSWQSPEAGEQAFAGTATLGRTRGALPVRAWILAALLLRNGRRPGLRLDGSRWQRSGRRGRRILIVLLPDVIQHLIQDSNGRRQEHRQHDDQDSRRSVQNEALQSRLHIHAEQQRGNNQAKQHQRREDDTRRPRHESLGLSREACGALGVARRGARCAVARPLL